MSNTEKLLRAFIEVSGFDIEQIGVGRSQCDCMYSNPISRSIRPNCPDCKGSGIIAEAIDYKVTKKKTKTITVPVKEYTNHSCSRGGIHISSSNKGCSGNYSQCVKCDDPIEYISHQWLSQ